MLERLSPPLLAFSLVAIVVLMLNIYALVMGRRRNALYDLLNLIRDKESNSFRADQEATAAVEILYANTNPVLHPIYIFANENHGNNLLIISLLRAVLRHLRLEIEKEMHEQGYLKMDAGGKRQFDIGMKFLQKVEKNVNYENLTAYQRIDKLIGEYMNGLRMHYFLLRVNKKPLPRIRPLFYIVQKTKKDSAKIIFPITYESVPSYSLI